MKRDFIYSGFEVTVELEPIWDAAEGVRSLPARGFVAVVHISKSTNAGLEIVTPIRLASDSRKPFATTAEALMAAYSAAQRLVDDTLAA
jgi:hypothetical protein